MTTLEDKILGERIHNYCSSSEGESENEDVGKTSTSTKLRFVPEDKLVEQTHWSGSASNTGPKGVIKDWQRYKQLESEKRECQDKEKLDLIKKLSITTCTDSANDKAKEQQIDDELAELLDEDFLLQYQKKRMAEMLAIAGKFPSFGTLVELHSGDDFLRAIDDEQSAVTIIIHIYDRNDKACKNMNEALIDLAAEYKNVKFCKFSSLAAGVSMTFKSNGIPALLIYKSGDMIGNFVRVTDELTDEFDSSDVESFLTEFGMLPDKLFISDTNIISKTN
ncbi:phosducin-like protein [Topomyia yanbarensis]|uniref:phosducin-like protein n=1 Tax=Topomyia yanbarensis TaxID=2498891 RepID=UPI00273BF2EB|nr:phosducin-like protein [Topomyia yanbarensis]